MNNRFNALATVAYDKYDSYGRKRQHRSNNANEHPALHRSTYPLPLIYHRCPTSLPSARAAEHTHTHTHEHCMMALRPGVLRRPWLRLQHCPRQSSRVQFWCSTLPDRSINGRVYMLQECVRGCEVGGIRIRSQRRVPSLHPHNSSSSSDGSGCGGGGGSGSSAVARWRKNQQKLAGTHEILIAKKNRGCATSEGFLDRRIGAKRVTIT